jgi:hypothetical protein
VSRLVLLKSCAVVQRSPGALRPRPPDASIAGHRTSLNIPGPHVQPHFSIHAFVTRSWLLLTIPVALAALALLSLTVSSLLRTVRGSVIASAPIRAEQEITMTSSGNFALNLEGPVFTSRPAGLRFALSSAQSGTPIALNPIAFRTDVSSMSRSRIELYSFTIPSPGAYTLRVDGIDSSIDYSSHAILITRRYRVALVLHVLALVALGVALIGSMVITGLVLSGRSLTPASRDNTIPFTQPP